MLVVYGHASRALYANGAAPVWATTVDRLIYAFHMPLFFLVAGLFVWPSLAKGRERFVTDKLATIVYPYFLWSLIEGGLEIGFAGEVNSPIEWHDLAMVPIIPIEQFWFLYVMAVCLLLALACFPSRAALAGVTVCGLVIVHRYGTGNMVLRTLAFLPYLAAGILFAAPIHALGRSRAQAGAVLAGAASVFVLGIASGADGTVGGLVVALAGSGIILAAAALLGAGRAGSALALLGQASLAIFVMHTIFSAGLRISAKAAGLAVPTPAMLVATVAVGIAGPLGLWLVAEHRGLSLPLGLGRPLRRVRRRSDPRERADGAGMSMVPPVR